MSGVNRGNRNASNLNASNPGTSNRNASNLNASNPGTSNRNASNLNASNPGTSNRNASNLNASNPSISNRNTRNRNTRSQPSPNSLYFGGLPLGVDETRLSEWLRQNKVGLPEEIHIYRHYQTRCSRGFAQVTFETYEQALNAIGKVNYKEFGKTGCCVRVLWWNQGKDTMVAGQGNIVIKNLKKDVTAKGLFDIFSQIPKEKDPKDTLKVLSCKVEPDKKDTLKGFVQFETSEEADAAMKKMENLSVKGHPALGNFTMQKFYSRQERKAHAEQYSSSNNLFLKNLGNSIKTEADLKNFIVKELKSTVERITSAILFKEKGIGFACFDTAEEAARVLDEFKKSQLLQNPQPGCSQPMYITPAYPKDQRKAKQSELQAEFKEKLNKGLNVYVKNLPEDLTDEGLKKLFDKFGDITSTKLIKDKKGKASFGFVCFTEAKSVTAAIAQMNDPITEDAVNKPKTSLYVTLAQPKKDRLEHKLNLRYGNITSIPPSAQKASVVRPSSRRAPPPPPQRRYQATAVPTYMPPYLWPNPYSYLVAQGSLTYQGNLMCPPCAADYFNVGPVNQGLPPLELIRRQALHDALAHHWMSQTQVMRTQEQGHRSRRTRTATDFKPQGPRPTEAQKKELRPQLLKTLASVVDAAKASEITDYLLNVSEATYQDLLNMIKDDREKLQPTVDFVLKQMAKKPSTKK